MSEAATATQVATTAQTPSLLTKFAGRFGVEANKMMTTLKSTAFRGEVSNEQMMALLIVADQYNLNPWTKEIYAFPDKNNGIVPVVGVDGWARIVNEHPQFDGCEFTDGPTDKAGLPEWIECTIFRKDREHPTTVREYMAECKRGTGPWGSHPRRMLRHKAFMQCGRLAFAFVGVYDEDEAQRIIEGSATLEPVAQTKVIADINRRVAPQPPIEGSATTEHENKPAAPANVDTQTGEIFAPPTYAEVSAQIKKARTAKDADAIAAAESLIDAIKDPAHQATLRKEVADAKAALA